LVTKEKALEQFKTIKNKYEIKNIIPISAQYEHNINYLLQFLVEMIPYPINTDLINKINSPLKGTVIRSFDVNKKSIAVEDINCAVIGGTIRSGMIKIGDKIKLLPGITKNNKIIPLKGRVLSLKTDEIELTEAYPGGLIGIGLSIDPLLSKEDRLVGNIIVADDNDTVKIFVKADVSYEIYDNIELKENENVSVMLYSLRRTAELISLNKQNKTLTFESKLEFAGEINILLFLRIIKYVYLVKLQKFIDFL
jgi:translation initiation factor 2 subunit 3